MARAPFSDEDYLSYGCIGAFFLPGTKVHFDELSLISLEKQLFPSGKQIKIYSANKKPVEPPDRSGTLFNDEVTPELFVGRPIDRVFRLIDNRRRVIHQRTFLAGEFTTLTTPDGIVCSDWETVDTGP